MNIDRTKYPTAVSVQDLDELAEIIFRHYYPRMFDPGFEQFKIGQIKQWLQKRVGAKFSGEVFMNWADQIPYFKE
jgi:hypothetical protein